MSESEFKNENLNIKLERLPGSNIALDVTISPKATEAAYEKAVKNINKEIVIPGFRKGKAPNKLITDKFKPQIEEEWKSILLNTALNETLQLTKVYPLYKNGVKPQIKNISLENGAEVKFSFEASPEIPNIKPEDLILKNITPDPVKEEDIQERIYELQLNQATWQTIEDRGIEEGDFAELDIDSLDNNTPVCKNQSFRVVKGKMGDWLYDLLIGKKTNDSFEGVSQKDECKECDDPTHNHAHEHESEFKPSRLKIEVKSIKTPLLPELDEEFAKKLGAESVEVLHKRIISSLEKNAKDRAQQHLRNQLEEIILEKYPFDIPSSLNSALTKKEASDEKRLKSFNNSVRMSFIVQKLAEELNLQINQEEIMEEFMIQAYMTNREESFINTNDDPKEIHRRIHSHLLDKKVKDYLIEKAHKS